VLDEEAALFATHFEETGIVEETFLVAVENVLSGRAGDEICVVSGVATATGGRFEVGAVDTKVHLRFLEKYCFGPRFCLRKDEA
jgi:hypothetical protein